MKKLLVYEINEQKPYIDITTWNVADLNGNRPFKVIMSGDTIPSGYTDISSITNWGNYGQNELNFFEVRSEIKTLLPESLSALTTNELGVVSEYKLDSYYLIYDYVDNNTYNLNNPSSVPLLLDYDILGLHKKRTLVKGELVLVEYYGKYNSGVYSDLVVREDRIYYRVNQMVSRREMEIKWYLNDSTVGTTKNNIKYYSVTEGMQELDTRRSNVISELKINTVGLIMVCSGITSLQAQAVDRPFLSTYTIEISKYLQGYEQELRNAITNDAIYSWLNLTIPNTGGYTIRMYLLDGIDVDYEINNINT